jgi:hypothetical protein
MFMCVSLFIEVIMRLVAYFVKSFFIPICNKKDLPNRAHFRSEFRKCLKNS